MKEVSERVPFQLPNKFTRVGFLFADMTSSDAGLQATMTNIKSNADPASETSKKHLQLFCPVLKKFLSGTKHDTMEIPD
eukprot:1965746-Ditylum_brightwellii.AAC.1